MKTHKIVMCRKCSGRGKIGHEVCVDYHKREWDTEYTPCKACNETGREIEITEKSYKPFKG